MGAIGCTSSTGGFGPSSWRTFRTSRAGYSSRLAIVTGQAVAAPADTMAAGPRDSGIVPYLPRGVARLRSADSTSTRGDPEAAQAWLVPSCTPRHPEASVG